jgi:hypothetical protein
MPVFDRFMATRSRPLPVAYLLHPADTATIARLGRHGIRVDAAAPVRGPVDEFVVDSIVRSTRPFQGHQEVRLVGRWRPAAGALGPMVRVNMRRQLPILAMYLLDPESDDSFATWNGFDAALAVGSAYPVLRVPALAGPAR